MFKVQLIIYNLVSLSTPPFYPPPRTLLILFISNPWDPFHFHANLDPDPDPKTVFKKNFRKLTKNLFFSLYFPLVESFKLLVIILFGKRASSENVRHCEQDYLKGHVDVIPSDLPFIQCHVRFTTVHLKALFYFEIIRHEFFLSFKIEHFQL